MSAVLIESTEPSSELELRRLLARGMTHQDSLFHARQQLAQLERERAEIRQRRTALAGRAGEALRGGRDSTDRHLQEVGRLEVQVSELTQRLENKRRELALLEDPATRLAFERQAEEHASQAQEACEQIEAIEDQLRALAGDIGELETWQQIGCLQRLVDFLGVGGGQLSWPFSPAVQRRRAERLSSIFGHGPKTPPASPARAA